MSNNALTLVREQPAATSQTLPVPSSLVEIRGYAELFATSGYFIDAKQMAQCAVKIIAGAEVGLKPFDSINGIHMIQNKPTMGAHLLAKLVKMSGKYDYRVVKMDDEAVSIDFYQTTEKIGTSTFTKADAQKAGTQNMGKFPRNMLFARAMSNGVRWFCPDVTAGPIYTPEELGAPIDEQGNYIPPAAPIVEFVATAEPKQIETKPDNFRKELVGVAVKAFKEAGIITTLQNVASTLFIAPGEAETRYWSKGKFGFSNMNDEDVYRLAHYAKSGNALPEDAPVAEMLEELRAKLTESP